MDDPGIATPMQSGDDISPEVFRLIAGKKRSGEVVYENVLAIRISGSRVTLTHSPGLALGIAAGDVIDVESDGSYELVSHGGNIAVHIYGDPAVARSIEPKITGIGGWWDGGVKNLTIYTFPADAKFSKIEPILNELASGASHVEWYYGNVYDLADGVTPLNWWLKK
jgi:hypothetical protein